MLRFTTLCGQKYQYRITKLLQYNAVWFSMWCVSGPPFYNGAGGLTTHKGRPRKRCKIALPECSPPSDGDPFAAPNFGNLRSSLEISCFIHFTCKYEWRHSETASESHRPSNRFFLRLKNTFLCFSCNWSRLIYVLEQTNNQTVGYIILPAHRDRRNEVWLEAAAIFCSRWDATGDNGGRCTWPRINPTSAWECDDKAAPPHNTFTYLIALRCTVSVCHQATFVYILTSSTATDVCISTHGTLCSYFVDVWMTSSDTCHDQPNEVSSISLG